MNAKLSDEAGLRLAFGVAAQPRGKSDLGPARRVVFSAGLRKVEVVGPLLEDEAAEQHKGVWD